MTTASIHDSTVTCGIIDAVRDHEYILMDAAYDSSDIYYYVMENTHAIPFIDTNRRRGIVDESLAFNRKEGIITRERERSRYGLRWEIERTLRNRIEKKRSLNEKASLEDGKSVQI